MADEDKTDVSKKPAGKEFRAWALAGELGYTIAVPIVALALLGRIADKYLNTSPWLLLTGIVLSILISTWLVYRKTIDLLR
jgi:ATP synthase protein I